MNITETLGMAANSTGGPTTPYYIPFLDPWRRKVAEIVMDYVVNFSIAVLGIITNTLVILVYARQGFRESVSVSMTTIAVWDLIKCLAGMMERLSGIIEVWDPAAALSWSNISVVAFNYLISFSSYVTSVMAAYVAVERCLCVSVPLKVKWMLTPKVTLVACLIISTVVFGCFVVMFGIYDILWVWDQSFNATTAIYLRNTFYVANEGPLFIYYNLSGTLWPLIAFVVILVCTIIIVSKLRQGSKFRNSQKSSDVTSGNSQENASAQSKQQQLSNRDRQVVKMLLVIIVIYIISLSPRIALYIGKYIVYDLYFLRRYHYLFAFVLYWLWFGDLTNGAVNFFVFYAMSTSFRTTFKEMFTARSKSSSLTRKGGVTTV